MQECPFVKGGVHSFTYIPYKVQFYNISLFRFWGLFNFETTLSILVLFHFWRQINLETSA